VIRHESASSARLASIPRNSSNSMGRKFCGKDHIEPSGEGPLGLSLRNCLRHDAACLLAIFAQRCNMLSTAYSGRWAKIAPWNLAGGNRNARASRTMAELIWVRGVVLRFQDLTHASKSRHGAPGEGQTADERCSTKGERNTTNRRAIRRQRARSLDAEGLEGIEARGARCRHPDGEERDQA
jgi:hypothetical protein